MGPSELKKPTFPDFKVHTTTFNNFLNYAQISKENIRIGGETGLLGGSLHC